MHTLWICFSLFKSFWGKPLSPNKEQSILFYITLSSLRLHDWINVIVEWQYMHSKCSNTVIVPHPSNSPVPFHWFFRFWKFSGLDLLSFCLLHRIMQFSSKLTAGLWTSSRYVYIKMCSLGWLLLNCIEILFSWFSCFVSTYNGFLGYA